MGFSLSYPPHLTGAWECLLLVKPRYPFPAPWPPSGISAFVSLFCICGAEEFSFEFPVLLLPLSPAPAPLPNLLTALSFWLPGAKQYCQFFAQPFTAFTSVSITMAPPGGIPTLSGFCAVICVGHNIVLDVAVDSFALLQLRTVTSPDEIGRASGDVTMRYIS